MNVMQISLSSPRGVGRRGRATHGNLTVTYICRVGILIGHHAFNLSISYSIREVNHLFLIILTLFFCQFFFTKCQNPRPMPDPTSGLTLIGAWTICIHQDLKSKINIRKLKIYIRMRSLVWAETSDPVHCHKVKNLGALRGRYY